MNIINSIIGILLLAIMIVIGYKIGQIVIELNSPIMPKMNTVELTLPEQPSLTTVRWNHFPLTVHINDDFIRQKNPEYVNDVRAALDRWQSTGIVSFSLVDNPDNADMIIEWAPNLKEIALDTLGNTDLKFINITQFGIIQNATIELLTKSESKQLSSTDMVNLALHEIGHSVGLSHTDEDDIMNPVLVIPSKTAKEISTHDINNLQKLYELPSKPDLEIIGVNATKFTFSRFGKDYFYLNISISIQNIGLINAENFNLRLDADDIKINEESIQKLEIGNILNVFEVNIKTNKNFSSIQVKVDSSDSVDELNETNNFLDIPVNE